MENNEIAVTVLIEIKNIFPKRVNIICKPCYTKTVIREQLVYPIKMIYSKINTRIKSGFALNNKTYYVIKFTYISLFGTN